MRVFDLDLTYSGFAYYEMIPSKRQSVAIIAFTVILIILVNLFWWVIYTKTETRFEYQLSQRLATTARMGAVGFTPDLVSSLVAGHLTAYDSTLSLIERIQVMDQLSEVFIVGPDMRYFATTLIMPDSVYYLAALNGVYLDSAFTLYDPNFWQDTPAQAVVTEGYPVGEIYLKSAFVPLMDTAGVVSAVMGIEADIDYTDVLGDLRRNLYLSSAFSIGAGILFGLFFFIVQRRLGRAERSIMRSQAQANLGRMVAVVSHEIKNPLMIMRASAERLNKQYREPEAEFLLEEIDRLNTIVGGYLDIAGGKKNLNKEQLDTVVFMKRIVDQFQPRLARNGVAIRLKALEAGQMISADAVALRQAIINIILNAAEAVKGRNDAEIVVACRTEQSQVIIEITDNGKGIDKNSMRHIFDPFYTTRATGSGLGLFHSKRLVEEMGGHIIVTSKPDGPTVVSLEFTVQEQDA